MKSKIKTALSGKFIRKAKEEIESKSTLNGFPRPSDKDWFKRKGYVNESIGSRMASKIRAGNFGMGNTYMRVKNCILCGKENMNHESHILMKCEGLDLLRRTTDIPEFLLKQHSDDSESGHNALRKYMDPRTDTITTLSKRTQFAQSLLKAWEREFDKQFGKNAATYCYCKDTLWGKMIGCDGCQDWFHLPCAGLDEDFASLDDWYCKFCSAAQVNEEICICNAYQDPTRSTIKCMGQCEVEYHPECLGLDDDVLASSASWRCGLC